MPSPLQILLPGEPQEKTYLKISAAGTIDLEDNLWKKLNDVADKAP